MMFEDDPGGTTDGEASAFARSSMVGRSPTGNEVAVFGSTNVEGTPGVQDEQLGLGLSLFFTPKASRTKLAEVKRKVDELYEFIKDKNNVHHKIRALVTGLKSSVLAAEREQQAWKTKAEETERKLKEKSTMLVAAMETPNGPTNNRAEKRDRETPGDDEVSKKQKEDKEEVSDEEVDEWETVRNKKKEKERKEKERKEKEKKEEEKKKEEKKKEEKKKEEQKKEKRRRERSKGDALVIGVKGGTSYADLLRKVRDDPALKELGENVVKTRRTQKGEMLFELKKDPTVRSSLFKSLVEKSLGEEANVRALSQETVIECRDLDEITTVEEVKSALTEFCGDVPMEIRLRKAYGGTQTAVIRLSPVVANKLLEKGKVKVGWSVCPLKAVPRSIKKMERCFQCMGFGHYARNCEGPDRSKIKNES